MKAPLLELKNIGKIYVSENNVAVGIRGVNASFERGEFVAVTGKSGSGKDSVYTRILEETNLNPIIPYTTRPRRPFEENGKDYHFVSDEFMFIRGFK